MHKDKKQVIGEVLSDEAIRQLLLPEPGNAGTPPALHKLVKAYRGLRPDDFARYLVFFREQGLDLQARNARGECFTDLIAGHRQGAAYAGLVRAARA